MYNKIRERIDTITKTANADKSSNFCDTVFPIRSGFCCKLTTLQVLQVYQVIITSDQIKLDLKRWQKVLDQIKTRQDEKPQQLSNY